MQNAEQQHQHQHQRQFQWRFSVQLSQLHVEPAGKEKQERKRSIDSKNFEPFTPTTAASLILHKLSSDQLVTKKQQEKQQEKTDQILDDDESFFDESDSAFSSQQDEIEDDDAFADIPASQLRFIQSMMDAQAWDIPTITSPYKFWTGKLFRLVCYMCL